MATAKKEVATIDSGLPAERPSWMKGDGTRGNEGVKVEDLTIPRLSIIQDLSPQHKEGKPEFIEGAKPKMIFNTVTGELYGQGIYIVPVLFRKEWVIWKDQNKGGGFRGAFSTEEEAVRALQDLDDKADCEVVDSAQHFVLVVDAASTMEDPKLNEAVISMSKSQMKISRQMNSMIHAQGGDRWERMYKLTVVDDQNAAGQEYYNWKPHQMGFVSESIFKAAEKMYEAVRSGTKDVKRDEGSPASTSTHAAGEINEDDDF